MKKSLKIGIVLIILLVTIFSIDVQALSLDSIINTGKDWMSQGSKNPIVDDDKIIDAVLPVGQMLTAIGVAILFGALILLGIKYMMAEPDQKAKLKQQLIGIVISGVVIFGAFTIWKTVYNFFYEIF